MGEPMKTPLYDEHIKDGGRMVEFAGWWMPVQYEGLRQEHVNVRSNVGVFDVSHMGEIRIKGEHALKTVEWLTTNHVEKLEKGQAQYTLFANEIGGIVDDLIIYCLEKNSDYLLCVNAANRAKDLAWVIKHNQGAEITDESDNWAQIAVQGPKAIDLLDTIFSNEVSKLKTFSFAKLDYMGAECIVAKTGYTGEEGCEVFVPPSHASKLWQQLRKQGEAFGIKPVGLGARDTLRTEMKYSLYGHEITDTTNPYQAGLGWVVKPDTKDFLGKQAIVTRKDEGFDKKLIGFKMIDRGIPRQGYKVLSLEGEEIGEVTSGTVSPSLNENIGIAYVPLDYVNEGSEFYIEIRTKKIKARVVKTPFVNE